MLQNKIVLANREVVPDNGCYKVWHQQEGCLVHNSREVGVFLHDTFGEIIISNSSPVWWPARYPDLLPLDFFQWSSEIKFMSLIPQKTDKSLNSVREITCLILTEAQFIILPDPSSNKCLKCIEANKRYYELQIKIYCFSYHFIFTFIR